MLSSFAGRIASFALYTDMSDNTVLNLGGGGDTIATEDIGGGVKITRCKIVLGGHGTDGGDVTSNNPVPVSSYIDCYSTFDGLASQSVSTAPTQMTSQACSEAIVQNDPGSNGNLLVGGSSHQSLVVTPGTTVKLRIANTNQIYACKSSNNANVTINILYCD